MKPDTGDVGMDYPNAWSVRFWVWLSGSLGQQAVVRVVRLGWLH